MYINKINSAFEVSKYQPVFEQYLILLDSVNMKLYSVTILAYSCLMLYIFCYWLCSRYATVILCQFITMIDGNCCILFCGGLNYV